MKISLDSELIPKLIREYQQEPNKGKWEEMSRQIVRARRTYRWYDSGSAERAYIFTRALFAACGRGEREEIAGCKVLFVGPGPGLKVRIARDLGAEVVGVDPDPRAVQLGHSLGVVRRGELIETTAQEYLKEVPAGSFDAIIGSNLPPYLKGAELQAIYEEAEGALNREGVLALAGDMSPVVKQEEGFPVSHFSIIGSMLSLRAIKTRR